MNGPESAAEAGLRYVSDAGSGIRRRKAGKGFVYFYDDKTRVTDRSLLRRIRAPVIPPAWTHVWICPISNGHIQASGRDAKGRKQYRYHERWRATRDENKYGCMVAFGNALPRMRETVRSHLSLQGLPREKVLALVVRLLEATGIRVGNEEYARKNKSFGLTTLRTKHVDVNGAPIRFKFRGKAGKEHSIDYRDKRIAKIVARMSDLPGHELFQYLDSDGVLHGVNSTDVNEYIQQVAGAEFSAKDFRTWTGTVITLQELMGLDSATTAAHAKRNVVAAVRNVATRLGNTVAICRKCYIHPVVVETYMDVTSWGQVAQAIVDQSEATPGLESNEVALLRLLQK